MLTGVNIEATRQARAGSSTIPVIASGGLHDLDDIEALCAVEAEGIDGVITGRAIYEGTLDFADGAEARRRAGRGRAGLTAVTPWRSPSASSPASTSPPAASSRASTSSSCATPAIRSRSRARYDDAGRRRAHLPRHHRHQRRARPDPAHHRGGRRRRCSSRSRSAAACARSTTCGACSTPAPTRSASTPPRSQNPQLIARRLATVRRAVHRRRHRRQAARRRRAGWEVFTHGGRSAHRARRGRLGAPDGRRSAPARSCSPAWTATARASGFDLDADPRGRRRGARSR